MIFHQLLICTSMTLPGTVDTLEPPGLRDKHSLRKTARCSVAPAPLKQMLTRRIATCRDADGGYHFTDRDCPGGSRRQQSGSLDKKPNSEATLNIVHMPPLSPAQRESLKQLTAAQQHRASERQRRRDQADRNRQTAERRRQECNQARAELDALAAERRRGYRLQDNGALNSRERALKQQRRQWC